ncbi:unnamed protein product [Bursaphelenchus okinawaensis]|uniref:glucuronosyltransferase n=1 Tax=Bursaphelenchus okinawaensis TaxID=465554 RepID=A0A811KYC3_9BILA|nr:unnamed protein product [Bursaphelenchus okinawaensis]CAG9114194.1 unnamed protein product [Bursaphelenchus okinawaensis]
MTSVLKVVVPIFAILHVVTAYNYLFVSSNFCYTHAVYNAKIAETLQKAGHQVHFVMFKSNKFVPFNDNKLTNVTTILADDIEVMSKILSGFSIYNDVFTSDVALMKGEELDIMLGMFQHYCRSLLHNAELQEILNRTKYDALFVESIDICGAALGHLHGIKPVFFMSPVPVSEYNSYSMGIPFNPNVFPVMNRASPNGIHMTMYERFVNWYEYYDSVGNLLRRMSNGEVFQLVQHLNLPYPQELSRNAALFIQNTNEFLDLPRPVSGKQVFVGGITVRAPGTLNEETQKIYDSAKKGVIYFSFGSLADNSKLPANTTQKTAAFITHCGLNSLNEAAFAGVPLIAIPLFGDQTFNTAVVNHIGNGIHVSKLQLTEETIVKALDTVLNSPKIRSRAKELSEMLNNQPKPPQQKLVDSVVLATRYPEMYNKLTLPGAEVSFVRYFGLDLLAVVLAAATATLVFVAVGMYKMYVTVRLFTAPSKVKAQ